MFTPVCTIALIIAMTFFVKAANKADEVLAAYSVIGYAATVGVMVLLGLVGVTKF